MADKASAASASAKVKMIKNPAGFVEPDMVAAQTETDENRFAGPNPFPAGSARAAAWDHLKHSQK